MGRGGGNGERPEWDNCNKEEHEYVLEHLDADLEVNPDEDEGPEYELRAGLARLVGLGLCPRPPPPAPKLAPSPKPAAPKPKKEETNWWCRLGLWIGP